TADIRADAKANKAAQRLQTIPGTGPMTASALVCALPDIAGFKSGRDLSAWPGLTPRPHATGGRERLGRISETGNRSLRSGHRSGKTDAERQLRGIQRPDP
ncbi:MAG: transposase, partial [Rhodobacter sp.]|nr:transposase [Rhodobacter sp.]